MWSLFTAHLRITKIWSCGYSSSPRYSHTDPIFIQKTMKPIIKDKLQLCQFHISALNWQIYFTFVQIINSICSSFTSCFFGCLFISESTKLALIAMLLLMMIMTMVWWLRNWWSMSMMIVRRDKLISGVSWTYCALLLLLGSKTRSTDRSIHSVTPTYGMVNVAFFGSWGNTLTSRAVLCDMKGIVVIQFR